MLRNTYPRLLSVLNSFKIKKSRFVQIRGPGPNGHRTKFKMLQMHFPQLLQHAGDCSQHDGENMPFCT